MTEQDVSGQAVDWDAAVRHERRRELLLSLAVFPAVPALAVLRFEDGRVLVGAVVFALIVLLGAAGWTFYGMRSGRTDRYRVLHALLAHVDPGPASARKPTSWPGSRPRTGGCSG